MLDKIKQLRDMTSLGINDCKNALKEANGDFDEALKVLKKRGAQMLAKKSQRETSQGLVDSYIHFSGNMGALVEVNCETDFVAKTDVFKKFVKDLAMQVVAANAQYLTREDIPESELKDIGNIDDYAKQACLMEQPFIKESKKIISEYLKEIVSQTGENIVVKRFVRFAIGE
ncbi:MAG: elongation factor Ts [Candidatus Omnitrophica bacterium]|nr:elongation factor Ts [Candidatus Omnitrophota bacterium]MDD5080823.1 elongation factor Ts [Candidatus Omnitrophota bacterium]MDD5441232.1 elongation factor Ts [Candidatus Omnitrophota bacterium]